MQQSRGKLNNIEFKGRYTLGNKLQRHVAATRRSDKSYVCTEEFL